MFFELLLRLRLCGSGPGSGSVSGSGEWSSSEAAAALRPVQREEEDGHGLCIVEGDEDGWPLHAVAHRIV